MQESPGQPDTDRLENFPITFFAIVMGTLGLTLALHSAEMALGTATLASLAALIISLIMALAIAAFYGFKTVRYPAAVIAEWGHPVRIAFFPTVSISLLLLSIATLHQSLPASHALWIAGTVLQGVLTLAVIANWIGHRPFQPAHLSPAWFIPAVGNVIVPVAGAAHGYQEISWLFFSAGLVFWIILLTLVMNRLIFHDPLPGRLAPTLVILIAPPAVAFIAYHRMTGEVDAFARILINSGYVFAAIVATQLPRMARLAFALSWWALSFPLAALAIASFVFARSQGSAVHQMVGFALLAVLVVAVVGLAIRTLMAIRVGQICVPE